jgi:hypothetical protein
MLIAQLVLGQAVTEALDDGLGRLYADVAREHDLLDLLQDGRVDLFLACENVAKARDEPAAARGEPLAHPEDVRLGGDRRRGGRFRRFGNDRQGLVGGEHIGRGEGRGHRRVRCGRSSVLSCAWALCSELALVGGGGELLGATAKGEERQGGGDDDPDDDEDGHPRAPLMRSELGWRL